MARPKGSKNRATQEARRAIALFVDGNAHRLQGWLDQVANGVPRYERDSRGRLRPSGDYVVPPDPFRALTVFNALIEYHVPKLSRAEVQVEAGKGLVDLIVASRSAPLPAITVKK